MDHHIEIPSSQNKALDNTGSKPPSTLRRVGIYAIVRLLTIGITIVLGIFIAIVVANKGGGIDASVSASLFNVAQHRVWSLGQDLNFQERQEEISKFHAELLENSGMNDPFVIKHIRWTWNALRLDLGEAIYSPRRALTVVQQGQSEIKNIILTHLPNTLALVGAADLLVFVIGIPLSLYLSRNYGNWIDKILNVLSPLSSVPSWVHGVLLILVFAVTIRLLPPGGMYDIPMPDTRQGILASRLKHMILPTLAIFLSLFFQLVYSWRNYFMIYSNEDYVEFAVAKGLSGSVIQNKYILRPSLPYVLTGFALTLVSFWQMATALEIVFNWDGIGRMYILSLPHFRDEAMFPGEMGLTIGIVVIFAYVLGMMVFLLDIAYAIVDPRIRLGGNQQRVRAARVSIKFNPFGWVQKTIKNLRIRPHLADTAESKAVHADARDTRRTDRTLLVVLFLVVGVLLGLAVGWLAWPVQYVDASPADLHPGYQQDYIHLVVDSFNANQDSALAHQRLDAVGEDAALLLGDYINQAGEDDAAVKSILLFARNYDLSAAYPSSLDSELDDTSSNLMLVLVAIGLSVAVVLLYVKLVNRTPEGKPTSLLEPTGSDIQLSRYPFQRTIGRIRDVFQEMVRYPSAVAGMVILMLMMAGSLYAVIRYPYTEVGRSWYQDASDNSAYVPRTALPKWVNLFRTRDLPETIAINSAEMPETKAVKILENGNPDYTFTFEFDYPYRGFPSEGKLYFDTQYQQNKPFATLKWITPDGREFDLANAGVTNLMVYFLDENIDTRKLQDHVISYRSRDNEYDKAPVLYGLFADPEAEEPVAVPGTYQLEIKVLAFEPDTEVDVEIVLMGEVYGLAGTDIMRRDLLVPLLWGMPFALVIGLFGALLTTIVSMLFAAFGVWFGGWADSLVQRVTEANMTLPVVAMAVLFYAFYGANLWTILTVIVALNAFGSPTKTFRAAFMQVKESGYIEAAQAYGAPNRRIIFHYMIPRILPVLIPQLVTLIPGFIFLEATLGLMNVKSNMPTWGKVIYDALYHGATWGSKFWVLEPIALLLLTGFAFSMMGFALDRVLNPRLQQGD